LGHEEALLPRRLSGGCGFRKETFTERAATSETGQPQSFARIPSGYMLKI